MGKNLIIKGADFSANAIAGQVTWYVNEYDQAVAAHLTASLIANNAYAGFAPNYDFGGKTINILKFVAGQAGVISLWLGNSATDTSAVKVAEITITSEEVGTTVVKQFSPINVPSGKKLWIGKSTDTGRFKYTPAASGPGSTFGAFWVLLGSSSARQNGSRTEVLYVNWGFIS